MRAQTEIGHLSSITAATFDPVKAELELWRQTGATAQLWLRDDDAVEPTPLLEKLVASSGQHDIPLLLCLVPEPTGEALRDWLAPHQHVSVCVHGFAHRNHAPLGEKAQELGPHRPAHEVCAELSAAHKKLRALYDGQLSDILVPPWNRIAPDVVRELRNIGFSAISTFGKASEASVAPDLPQLNTHLDIIDWKGSRGGRDPNWLADELAKLLAEARLADGKPIGVLTHHLVHDDLAWEFLEALFQETAEHPAVTWARADDLI